MKQEIKIPQMGESVNEATIGKILQPSGAIVKENEEIVELETEKVNQVLYAPTGGTVAWVVKEGQSVKIGEIIGSVDDQQTGTEIASQKPVLEEKIREKEPEKEKPQDLASKKLSAGKGQRIMIDTFVEELQQTRQIEKPAKQKEEPIQERETRRPLSRIRQTIAKRLVDSLHTAAMLTTFNEVDMSEIIHLRAKHKESILEKHGVKLGFMSFFVKAVVEGLKAFPDLNSYLDGEEIVTRHYFDIGIAVGTERGLIVPVVRNCDALTFPQIEQHIHLYAQKARDAKLAIDDLQGGGFTITNGGVYGSMLSTPILNPPQVGILGMHKIMKRSVVVEDTIVIRPMMYLALSYDHRIVDGKEAVSFLVCIKEILEDPSQLLFLPKQPEEIANSIQQSEFQTRSIDGKV